MIHQINNQSLSLLSQVVNEQHVSWNWRSPKQESDEFGFFDIPKIGNDKTPESEKIEKEVTQGKNNQSGKHIIFMQVLIIISYFVIPYGKDGIGN